MVAPSAEFQPVFSVRDDISGEEARFTGLYRLTAMAGGYSPDNLTTFDPEDHMYVLLHVNTHTHTSHWEVVRVLFSVP